jgi:hypothetical protein
MKSPKAFFSTMGLNDSPSISQFQAPPRTERSDHFLPNTSKRTWSYYEKLRQEKPEVYYDRKTLLQLDKDSQALGEAFFDS